MIRFYIAEDDKLIREGICDCFPWQSVGAELAGSAADGKTALDYILAGDVDVVITDVVMPGLNGIELANALRAARWQGEILMMSAFQDIGYVKSALKAQAVDFLFKPVQMDELMDGVKRAIERSASRAGGAGYDERAWLKRALNALNTRSHAQLSETLEAALTQMCSDGCVTQVLRERAQSMLTGLAGHSALERASKRLDSAAYDIVSLTDADAIQSLYRRAAAELTGDIMRAPRDWQFAERVARVVGQNLKRVDADRLARELNMSRASFYRQFAQCFEESLNDYILNMRIDAAKRLLGASDLKVYEVADKVGYQDVNYFTKLFKHATGLLPSEFRAARDKQDG